MPEREGLDDNEALLALIGLWRDASEDIDSQLAEVHDQIRAELGRLSEDNTRLKRLKAQARRLDEIRLSAESILDDLLQETREFRDQGRMIEIYAAGAGIPVEAVSFSKPHRAAVEVLSTDLFDNVLAATEFVDDDAKLWVRQVSRRMTAFRIVDGSSVKGQARALGAELRREFLTRGIGSVRYKDGSRHSFGEYAEMLLRTKTGTAYNVGTLNEARLQGYTHVEILDSPDCGLTAHNDPQLANGLIVPLQVAYDWPTGHPNCRRALAPRFDVSSTPTIVETVQNTLPRPEVAAFEAALAREAQEARRRAPRRARRRRTRRRVRNRG